MLTIGQTVTWLDHYSRAGVVVQHSNHRRIAWVSKDELSFRVDGCLTTFTVLAEDDKMARPRTTKTGPSATTVISL